MPELVKRRPLPARHRDAAREQGSRRRLLARRRSTEKAAARAARNEPDWRRLRAAIQSRDWKTPAFPLDHDELGSIRSEFIVIDAKSVERDAGGKPVPLFLVSL
jgi:hypothetical protein